MSSEQSSIVLLLRFPEYGLFVYKRNINIAVIAGHIERFFSTLFVGQITLAFFDFCLNSKIVIASDNRSLNIPVLHG